MNTLELTCPWSAPNFLFYSTDSGVPSLLYYSYIPIILGALFFCVYVLYKNHYSLLSKILFFIGLFFSGYTLNAIFQWTSNNPYAQMFSWQLNWIFELSIFLLATYFVYVFFAKDKNIFLGTLITSLLFLSIIIFLPTTLNISQFYLTGDDCGGVLGSLWIYIYTLEILLMLAVAYICVHAYRLSQNNPQTRGQALLLGIGSIVFLGIFSIANILGEVTKIYQVNLIGPIGMLCFIGVLAYMIVKYQTFNVKLIATQALVAGIAVLIGARLFYSTTTAGTILSAVTLVGFLISGVFLIRSVKREVAQREKIEQLAGELKKTNERQETLIHFIGHEVKGFLTKDASAFAALSEGDFGELPDALKPIVTQALEQSRNGARSVTDLLTASNQKKGTVSYTKESFDLKTLIADAVEKAKSIAEKKGLTLSFTADESSYQMTGDKAQISDHVLRNIIDNSINYTSSGAIIISLKKENNKFIFAVKDTGIGITEEDKKNLFTEGGHGKDSQKVNVHSTGYGLYIAKNIVLAHGGVIRAESDGAGKGSTFVVEFPA